MKLPLRVIPMHGEIFSSWFTRLAHAHGDKVQSLAYRILGRGARLTGLGDIDRGDNILDLERIAEAAHMSFEEVHALTIASYRNWLWADAPIRGARRWVRPVVDRQHKRKSFGQQVCLICLKTDQEPFIRKSWRLSFHCVCPKHRCLLIDKCQICHTPVIPHRGDIGLFTPKAESVLVFCWKCGADLRETTLIVGLDESLVEHQQVLLDVLARGWIEIGGRAIRSTLFFDGLWMLWSFFDSPKWSRGLSANARLSTDTGTPRYGGIDGHTPEQRMLLLNSSKSYLADWPESLVAAMHEHRLSSNKLLHFSQTTLPAPPFWLWEPIHLRCDQTSYVPSDCEIKEALEYVVKRDAQVTIAAVCKVLNLKNNYSSRVAYLVLGESI